MAVFGEVREYLVIPDVGEIRKLINSIAMDLQRQHTHIDLQTVTEWEICSIELLNNIVQHNHNMDDTLFINLRILVYEKSVETEISDNGLFFDVSQPASLPEETSEGRRGLFLIQALSNKFEYYRSSSGYNLSRFSKAIKIARQSLDAHTGIKNCFSPPPDERGNFLSSSSTKNEILMESVFQVMNYISMGIDFSASSARHILHKLCHHIGSGWYMFYEYEPAGKVFLKCISSWEKGLSETADRSVSLLMKEILINCENTSWSDIISGNSAERCFSHYLPHPYGFTSIFPVVSGNQLYGILLLGRGPDDSLSEAATQHMIWKVCDLISVQIHSRKIRDAQIKSSALRSELEIARSIQQALLPQRFPGDDFIDMAVSCDTAHKVGGDIYDFHKVSDGEYLLVVLDVMGKGIPAAMFATLSRTILRFNYGEYKNPAHILDILNKHLYPDLSAVDMFITAQIVYLNYRENYCTVGNAGHPPVLIKSFNQDEITELNPDGLPIGVLPDTVFENLHFPLNGAFDMLLYTDGLTDISTNDRTCFFGINGLKEWMQSNCHGETSPGELLPILKDHLRNYSGNVKPADDQTVLFVSERRSPVAMNLETS